MKYIIQKLDGRHSYNKLFQYYIGFHASMSINQGPLNFSRCQKWFFQTYGWSAEIRTYSSILHWYKQSQNLNYIRPINLEPLPDDCNKYWSWTIGVADQYRIYVASEQELSFFCLANPVDQK